MIEFWQDKKNGIVKENLFSTQAEEMARKVAKDKGKNKPTQIRKFYDEITHYHKRLRANPDDFQKILPYIKMINSKLAYARGRELISENLKSLLTECINSIKDYKDYEVFVNFFESFLGYYNAIEKTQ